MQDDVHQNVAMIEGWSLKKGLIMAAVMLFGAVGGWDSGARYERHVSRLRYETTAAEQFEAYYKLELQLRDEHSDNIHQNALKKYSYQFKFLDETTREIALKHEAKLFAVYTSGTTRLLSQLYAAIGSADHCQPSGFCHPATCVSTSFMLNKCRPDVLHTKRDPYNGVRTRDLYDLVRLFQLCIHFQIVNAEYHHHSETYRFKYHRCRRWVATTYFGKSVVADSWWFYGFIDRNLPF